MGNLLSDPSPDAPKANVDLPKLPAGVLQRLFSYLDGHGLSAVASVCRHWRDVAHIEDLWEAAYERRFEFRRKTRYAQAEDFPDLGLPFAGLWRSAYVSRMAGVCRLRSVAGSWDISRSKYGKWAEGISAEGLHELLLASFEWAYSGPNGPESDGFDDETHAGFTPRQMRALFSLHCAQRGRIGNVNSLSDTLNPSVFSDPVRMWGYTNIRGLTPVGSGGAAGTAQLPHWRVVEKMTNFMRTRMNWTNLAVMLDNIGEWRIRGAPAPVLMNGHVRYENERITFAFVTLNGWVRGTLTKYDSPLTLMTGR